MCKMKYLALYRKPFIVLLKIRLYNELICLYELESQKDYCRMLKIPLKSAPEQER